MNSWRNRFIDMRYIRRVQNWRDIIKLPTQAFLNLIGMMLLSIFGGISNTAPPIKISSILIIRRNRIGDAICTLPWIQSLKINRPDIRVDVLCYEYNYPVFIRSESVDRTYIIPESYLKIRFLQALHPDIRALRNNHYDVVMNAGGFSSRSALIALVISGVYTIGTRSARGHLFDLIWSNSIKHSDLDESTHQVNRVAAIGRLIGVPHGEPLPFARLSSSSTKPEKGINKSVLLCPLVNRACSRWPDDRWLLLSNMIIKAGIDVSWLTYAPPDAPGILLRANKPEKRASFFTADNLIDIIPRYSIVICSEGGISHLAPALAVPCVALSGANISETWRPWSNLCHLVEKDNILDIHATLTFNIAMQLLTQLGDKHE